MKKVLLFVLAAAVVAVSTAAVTVGFGGQGPSDDTTPPSASPGETTKELAPIHETRIDVAESFPPQYFLYVQYGLRDGCARPGGYQVEREGDVIHVSVFAERPTDPTLACTQVYGFAEVTIPLGSDFQPGTEYTVLVNRQRVTFKRE
jgi:hypothetical protein